MKLFTKSPSGLLLLLSIFFMAVGASAQNTVLTGKVTDGTPNGYLPGAHISLEGTAYNDVTDNDGSYTLVDVKPGTYTVTVTYLGYDAYREEIEIASGQSQVSHDVTMSASFEILREVVVKGQRFGQSKALNTQKEAVNIKNVVSEEQIERFPDLNTAEVLQRVPGVTIQRDMGEGRFIALRGTAPNLTNVTVNGEQIAVSNGEARVVELDVISAGQLAGIEVTKVVTPDMDGNAIGGSVNLKTRNAFDVGGRQFKVMVGGSTNTTSSSPGFRSLINYADRLGKKQNLGISVNANFRRTNRERHNNEARWGSRDLQSGEEIPFALREVEIQRSANIRDRLGVSSQLEYRFNDNSSIGFSAMYNKRWDDQDRELMRMRVDRGDYISRTEIEEMRIIKHLHDRLEEQDVTAFSLRGDHLLGKLRMDYNFAISSASTKKDDGQLKPEFQLKKVNLSLSELDSKSPQWAVTNGININDGSEYEFDQTDFKIENTTNQLFTAALNFELPFNLSDDGGIFKFGGKLRTNDKDRADIRSRWKWKGDNDLTLSQFEVSNELNTIHDSYVLGRELDRDAFRNFFNANQGSNGFVAEERIDVNLGESYDGQETISGVYLMATQNFGDLLILGGLRAEFTNTEYRGNQLVLDDGEFVSSTPMLAEQTYEKLFPNLQFRYRASPNTNLRVALSKGLAQPNFFDQVPYSITDLDGEEIVRGNGDLIPATSLNYDLLAEHFFQGIGIISGGIFFKKMDDFVFSSKYEQSGGEFDGFEIEEPLNGDGADLLGFEISWQQQFTFLPGFLSGFGIYANYTYTNASNIDLGPDIDRDDIDVLPNQMANVSNLAINYEKAGLNLRLAANFSGKFIEEVGGSADEDEWRDSYQQWDFSGSYRVGKGIDLFGEINNIFNEDRYNYLGVTTRAIEHGLSGTTYSLGLKWSL